MNFSTSMGQVTENICPECMVLPSVAREIFDLRGHGTLPKHSNRRSIFYRVRHFLEVILNDVFYVKPADVVLFLNDRLPHNGPSDVNVVAIVVNERRIMYIDKSRFIRSVTSHPLQDISMLPNVKIRRGSISDEFREKIATYFMQAENSYSEFEAGLRAMRVANYSPFIQGTLFPECPKYSSVNEYNSAWNSLTSKLLPMDCIFIARLTDPVSRFIAWATHGPWSHVASYIGDGQISESVTTGMRRASLEIYKGQQFRTAAYRHVFIKEKKDAEHPTIEQERARFNDGYNYKMAIWYGLRAFGNDHSHELIPNSMIYGGNWELIDHV